MEQMHPAKPNRYDVRAITPTQTQKVLAIAAALSVVPHTSSASERSDTAHRGLLVRFTPKECVEVR